MTFFVYKLLHVRFPRPSPVPVCLSRHSYSRCTRCNRRGNKNINFLPFNIFFVFMVCNLESFREVCLFIRTARDHTSTLGRRPRTQVESTLGPHNDSSYPPREEGTLHQTFTLISVDYESLHGGLPRDCPDPTSACGSNSRSVSDQEYNTRYTKTDDHVSWDTTSLHTL